MSKGERTSEAKSATAESAKAIEPVSKPKCAISSATVETTVAPMAVPKNVDNCDHEDETPMNETPAAASKRRVESTDFGIDDAKADDLLEKAL